MWGARPDEVARHWTCDDVHHDPTVRLLRAVDVAAPPALVYAWLGNLRAAPYSYDLLDNRGRRSPRHLVTDLPPLATGQPVLSLFTVVRALPDEELDHRHRGRTSRALVRARDDDLRRTPRPERLPARGRGAQGCRPWPRRPGAGRADRMG